MIEVTLKFSSIEDLLKHFQPDVVTQVVTPISQGAQPAVASNTGSPSSPPPSPAPAAAAAPVSDGTQSAAAPAVSAPDKRKPGRPPKAVAAAAPTTPPPAQEAVKDQQGPAAPATVAGASAGESPTIAKVQEVAQKALERVKARVSADEPNPKAANIAVMAELRETLQKATGVERINLLATPEDMQKAIDALEALK